MTATETYLHSTLTEHTMRLGWRDQRLSVANHKSHLGPHSAHTWDVT